ncbi:MAG: NupC/NupG family nucleoside CNT transporter [Planctomycetota bacterium]|nr:NupC/NupG family nucleoside CNT transporter [Planctomycetota bacterium]
MDHLRGLLGVLVLLAIAFAFSSNRRRISPRIVIAGLIMQFIIAWACLSFTPVVELFQAFAQGVTRVISFADEGTIFLFGNLADASKPWGFVFAIKVLPVIIFFASFMSVLYYLGIMQPIVAALAWVLRRTLGVTGAEALLGAANIFLGQTEAPLTVKPFIASMTRSQIMAIMTGGFATIAGSVLAAYVGILGGDTDEGKVLFAKHLMTASLMSAPAGFVMAKIMLPETETPPSEQLGSLSDSGEVGARNVVDAAAAGATEGMRLAANVAAMLVAFVALIAMLNWPLAALCVWLKFEPLTFQSILGVVFKPLAWCMGIPAKDCGLFGAVLGQQVIATEFVAYLDLGKHIANGTMDKRSCQIATYALCGFANLPSIAIQIGGFSAMAPSRRGDFASIAPRAMVAGALACWMTGSIAGLFI